MSILLVPIKSAVIISRKGVPIHSQKHIGEQWRVASMSDFEAEIDFSIKDAVINWGTWILFLGTISTIVLMMYGA